LPPRNRLGRQQAGQHGRRQRREEARPVSVNLPFAAGRLHQGQPAPARASNTPPAKPTLMRDRLRMVSSVASLRTLPIEVHN
jgi:hypothetical protein